MDDPSEAAVHERNLKTAGGSARPDISREAVAGSVAPVPDPAEGEDDEHRDEDDQPERHGLSFRWPPVNRDAYPAHPLGNRTSILDQNVWMSCTPGKDAVMPIASKCIVQGCKTLTIGPFCIEHEPAVAPRVFVRGRPAPSSARSLAVVPVGVVALEEGSVASRPLAAA
jgi:hypothetical protein